MNRRNKKRKVATWILSKLLVNSFKAQEVGTFKDFAEGTQQQLKLVKDYDWFSIAELYELSNGDYDYFKLYPSLMILKANNHIEIIEDEILATKSKIKCTIEGELAYSDSFYQDDIDKYNHDKIYLWSRWALPALTIFLSLLTIWWSITQTNSLKNNIQQLEKRVLIIEGKQQWHKEKN